MNKGINSYINLGYSITRRMLANCDKASCCGSGNKIITPWGIVRMYHISRKGKRFYSLSKSKVFHNGGSLRIFTLRRMFASLGK